jgi:hypothetical protein
MTGYPTVVAEDDADPGEVMRTAMKRVAVALKGADVPFALAGGYAAFARGGPEPDHDVDFYLPPSAVADAERVLDAAGLRVEHPAEDWLVKVFDGDALVDLIHRPNDMAVTSDMLRRGDTIEVGSVAMPVLSATDVVLSKLLALSEHYCDFGTVLPAVRALREQLDWSAIEAGCAGNLYAEAFLSLATALELRP